MDGALILEICAGISALGVAITYVIKAVAPMIKKKQQYDDYSNVINDIEQDIKTNNKVLQKLVHDNRIQFRLMLSLTDHILTGNHEKELDALKNEILDYLMEG